MNNNIRPDVEELHLLFEISQIIAAADEPSGCLDPILELMATRMGMMRGAISIIDPVTKYAICEAAYGLTDAERRAGRYNIGEGVTGKVLESGQPIVLPSVSREPLFLNRTGARNLNKEEVSFICVPIIAQRKVLGTLSADRLFADSVNLIEDMRLLSVIAGLLARSIEVKQRSKERESRLEEENTFLREQLRQQFQTGILVGNSAKLIEVFDQILQVAPTASTVLLRGESGTGKELAARAIHAKSGRADKTFIRVSCAALPESLIESELFGHEKGAFTGAVDTRHGRFELAAGGTLFLDEIGELSLATQAKLLRVLQEKEFDRVGGTKTIKADVRLIAATNRDLERMTKESGFRQDLYYRLSVFPIILPPLRERREDIPLLSHHFADKFAKENGHGICRIDEGALHLLVEYDWPGNVRELENVIERAVILARDGVIEPTHLPLPLRNGKNKGEAPPLSTTQSLPRSVDHVLPLAHATGDAPPQPGTVEDLLPEAMEQLERSTIVKALEDSQGNVLKAAKAVGLTQRVMGLRMRKFGLNYRDFRSPK